jgi:hypothetical protein
LQDTVTFADGTLFDSKNLCFDGFHYLKDASLTCGSLPWTLRKTPYRNIIVEEAQEKILPPSFLHGVEQGT